MASFEEATAVIRRSLKTKEDRIDWQPGYMGDGAGNVRTSKANYYWVRYPFENSPAAPVYGVGNFSTVDGVRVIVGYLPWQPGLFQIICQSDSRLSVVNPADTPVAAGYGVGYVPMADHTINHMYLGVDPVFVNWRQITPLGVFPTDPASLSVTIAQGYIPRPGADIFVAEQTLDLTSHVPVSGARYVLISYDSTGTAVVTDGAINSGGFSALTAADIPDTPAGNWRSAAVVLYPGQTEIVETRGEIDFYDLRFPEETSAGTITPAQIALTDGHVIVGDAGGLGADVALSGDATIINTGALTIANDAVTYAKLQNVSATQRVLGRNTAGAGNAEEVTAAQVLDWLGSTRGAILYRGASGWAILAPGAAGDVLTSNGAGADPSYQSIISGAINVYNEIQEATSGTTYYLVNVAVNGTVRAYVNGIRQPVEDGTDDSDIVTFTTAPAAGDALIFDYELSLV